MKRLERNLDSEEVEAQKLNIGLASVAIGYLVLLCVIKVMCVYSDSLRSHANSAEKSSVLITNTKNIQQP